MTLTPKPSKSTPATAAALADSCSSLPPVLPTPSQSTSASIRQTRQRLERQLAEHEKLLQESNSGIGKNVLAGQISQIKDRLRDLDQQQRRDDPLERLRSLEREYRSNSTSTTSSSSRALDPIPSHSSSDLLSLPPAPASNATPTKRRSKVPSSDRRNTDIEFATEIGQGLLIEVRKMQALLQQKEEQLGQLEIQKTDLERAVEAMAKQLRQREEVHEKLKEETWDLEVAKQELTISVTELQQNLQKSMGEQARVVRQMNSLKAEMEKMRDREEKLSQQLETTKTRHEHDMGVMRRHGAQLQREKADQKKQIDALTSELAIAKAQSRIQKKSHVDLDHQYQQQQAQLLLASEMAAAAAAAGADPTDSTDPNAASTQDPNNGTGDRAPGSPKNKALEVETLKSSLAHAHRMVSNLRTTLHREKQEKFELKKLLAESQEAIEQMQNEDMWIDRPGAQTQPQQQPHRPSSAKAQKQKRHKATAAAGKNGRKSKGGGGGVSRVGRAALASASNRDGDDSTTEYYDDEDDDIQEESEYSSSAGDDDDDERDLDEAMMMMPPPAMMGLSLADQLKTATRMVSTATQTEPATPTEVVVTAVAAVSAAQSTGEDIGVQTDAEILVVAVAQAKELSTQTDAIPVAKTEEVSTRTEYGAAVGIEEPAPRDEEVSVQTETTLALSLQDNFTSTEDSQTAILTQANMSQPSFVEVHSSTMSTGVLEKPAATTTIATRGLVDPTIATAIKRMETRTDGDGAITKANITPATIDEASTQTDDVLVLSTVALKEDSTQTDPVIVVGAEICTQTDAILKDMAATNENSTQTPMVQSTEISTQTTMVHSTEMSTQTEEHKHSIAQAAAAAEAATMAVGETFATEGTMAAGQRSENEALVLSSTALSSHRAQQAPADLHNTDVPALTSAVTPHQTVALPVYKDHALSDGPMFITAEIVPQQHDAITCSSDATLASSDGHLEMSPLPMDGRQEEVACYPMVVKAGEEQDNATQEQQQRHPEAMPNFGLPTIPIVSMSGFDTLPQSMTSTADEQKQQQQQQAIVVSNFEIPSIPTVSITGFDSRPQSIATGGPAAGSGREEEASGAKENGEEMITRAEADAMVAAAVQAAIKAYFDTTNRVKEDNTDNEDHPPARPLNRPPSVLLSKATQRLASSSSSSLVLNRSSNSEEAPEFGTAYVSTQTITYPGTQQQQRHHHHHHHHQRRDSDSSASTAHTVDHRRPSFSSMQVNEAAQTANQHGISDPGAIALITQTMIGDWLWKYTRKAVGGGISERRHKRFFWIHPYTRTLYWSAHAPGVDGKESKAKSAFIESITTIPEHTPLGAAQISMLVQTPGRQLRITAPDMARHEVWYKSLSYLMDRADASTGDQDSKKSGGSSGVDPRYITPSLSTNSLLKKPSFPRLRPARSVSSFAGSVSSTNTTGSSSTSKRMQQHRQQHNSHHSHDDEDDDDEALEDVRMCCNGRHHVSKLEKDQHHQQHRNINTNPRRPPFHA